MSTALRLSDRDRLVQSINSFLPIWYFGVHPRGDNWFEGPLGNFYIRASTRLSSVREENGRRVVDYCWCLDFANLTARTPGQGLFTHLLDEFERGPRPYSGVYVECCTVRLGGYLLRRGYQSVGDVRSGNTGACFLKMVE